MRKIFFLLLFFCAAISDALDEHYWTPPVGETGYCNPVGEIATFYRIGVANEYTLGGSKVDASIGATGSNEIQSGGTLNKNNGYYYITVSVVVPATAAIGQTTGDFTLIQFRTALVDNLTNAEKINTNLDITGTQVGWPNPGASGDPAGFDYPYASIAGYRIGVKIKVPASYQGSTLYVYVDAQTYDSREIVLQHGYVSDSYFLLGSDEETPTPTATATNTPVATSTPTPSPTRTFTPPPTPTPSPSNTFTPSPTRTFTPTRTPTATRTSTRTPTNTGTPTDTPTATNTPTETPTIASGVFDLAVADILSSTSIQIPGFEAVHVVIRNNGTVANATEIQVSFTNTDDSLQYGSWVLEPGFPLPGEVVFMSCWLTSSGCTAGMKNLTAEILVEDAVAANNILSASIEFLPMYTPTPTETLTPTQTPTSTPTNTPTVTPTQTFTQTPTYTPTNTLTPTYTLTPTRTCTIAPTAITITDADHELNVWHGGARAGAFRGNILGATFTFSAVPPTTGVTIDDTVYAFRIGDIIQTATEMYWLSNRSGFREWVPFGYTIGGWLDDDNLRSVAGEGVDEITQPIRIDSEIAEPPLEIGVNNYNIVIPGLDADQVDGYDLPEIPYYVFERMAAAKNVWLDSDPISATMVIGVTIPVPTPVSTPTPAIIQAGTGIAVRTPAPGGTPGWIIDQLTPVPQATISLVAGANIQITTLSGGYIVSATTAGASTYLQVLGGGTGRYTITHNFGYQYPSIAYYTLDATAQQLHLVDTYCPDVNYATAWFSYIPSASSVLAVVSAGAGVGSGSMIINVTQTAEAQATATPLPNMAITVTGRPGSFAASGVNSGTLDLPTYTPTQTYTPTATYTNTPTPTPPKISVDVGAPNETQFDLYTLDGPCLVQGIINSSSAVVDLAYRNTSDNLTTVVMDEPWAYNALRVVGARADASIPFGNTGAATFTVNPGLNAATLCQFTDYGTEREHYDPADVRFVSNSETQIHFSYSPRAMLANFLIVSGTQLIGNGSANSFLINNGLGHNDFIVQVFEAGGDYRQMAFPAIVHSNTEQFTVSFSFVPTSNQYLVMWADARQVAVDYDSQYVRLDGANRMKARGDNFNSNVPLWAKSLKNLRGLDIRHNQDGSSTMPLMVWDGSRWYGYLGYDLNNLWNIAASRNYTWKINDTAIETLSDGLETINGSSSIVLDATARAYYGDTVDVGFGLSKSQSGYGRTTLAAWTPTPTPTANPATPTPTPTPNWIRRNGDTIENATQEWNWNDGQQLGNSVVESTIFRHRAVTIPTEAELLAFLHDGDEVYWLPGGAPIATADIQYKKADDTGNWFMEITYTGGAKDGTTERQRLTKYADADFEHHRYVLAKRLDGQIYLVQGWSPS